MPALTKEQWDILEPLLDEALELDAQQRVAMLARLRANSPALADELEALLVAESTTVFEMLGDTPAPLLPGATLEGLQVGAYTLDRCIGRGGMGTVWLAHRSDGRYEGRVAVKLLNLALVGRTEAEWFAREGRLLARLTHPGIARLLDAGVTSAGQPYLVLEHIEGQPIDQYANERRLTASQRIALCVEVLDAVAAAHANLVVHRDIKPSNILVDANGRVKLLDFGIGKRIVGDALTQTGMVTEHADRALTPGFAAPENIRGESASTATDVYSAAVLLYVLLSGRHPTGEGCATAAEQLRALLAVEPAPLSQAFARRHGHNSEETARRAALLSATPEQLYRYYRGDLDNILARALEKDPSRRYAGATSFRDDLVHFTRHEPVGAHRDSWLYRAGKFVRRHRAGTLTAAVIAMMLIGSTAFSYRQMLVAQRERDRADQALRRSRATTSFESLLFRLLEPGGQSLTYEQLLERGRHALEREYRGDPISRMQLGIQFAVNYLRGGRPATGDTIIRRTVAIADSLGDHEWQGRTRCELAIAQAEGGQADSALRQVLNARGFLTEASTIDDGTLSACDKAEAEALMVQRKFDEAALRFGAIVDRFRRDDDTLSENFVIALNDQSRAYFSGSRVREAQGIVQRLLEISHAGAASDPQTSFALAQNLSSTYDALGEFRGRRDFLQKEIALVAADPLASRQPTLLYEYAYTLTMLEEYDSAGVWFERALDRDLDTSRAYVAHLQLATIARKTQREADAQRHEREAQRALPPGIPGFGIRSATAVARMEAAAASRDSNAIRKEVDGQLQALDYSPESSRPNYIRPLIAAATALLEVGDHEKAGAYAEHAVRLISFDSLAQVRSGFVGHGLLLQARAALGRGDTARARERIIAAIPALAFGYGTRHSLHAAAVQLRNAMGN